MAVDSVVELARAAVRRLGRAAPTSGIAGAAEQSIAKIGSGPPYTIAIAGDLRARSALLDHLAGGKLFDPGRREPRRVVLAMQRGPVTRLRARRRDGSVEERTRDESSALIMMSALAPTSSEAIVSPAEPAPVAVSIESTALVRRPPWWAFWHWLMVWIRSWGTKRRGRAVTSMGDASGVAWLADDSMSATTVRSVEPAPATGPRALAHVRPRPLPGKPFAEALRDLFADDAVERIFLDVAEGPLPDKIIVIELPDGADARALATTGVDACIVAAAAGATGLTPQLEAVLALVPHLFVVGGVRTQTTDDRVRRLGDVSAVAPALVHIAELERALAVGTRVVDAVSRGREILQKSLDEAEAGFRDRIRRLEAKRIPDIDDRVAAELARLRPAIVEHSHRSLRRAVSRVDSQVAKLAAEWTRQLTEAKTTDALRTTAAKLDDSSPTALQAIRTEGQRMMLDDLTEFTLAQYLELVSELREGTTRTDPLPNVLSIEVGIADFTVGTNLGTVAPRLTSLFRSLDAMKTATLESLARRIDELRQHANAIFLDAEPRLEPAVTAALGIAWHADAERHVAWIEAELAREQTAIANERAALAPLAMALDSAITDGGRLANAVEELGRELPR